MKIIDKAAIDRCKARCVCEWCGFPGYDPHHVVAKGIGGCQIDHDWNLVCLCRECHTRHHQGLSPTWIECVSIIADREGVKGATICNFIFKVSRAPKGSKTPRLRKRPAHARNHRAAGSGEVPNHGVPRQKNAQRSGGRKPRVETDKGGRFDI